MEFLHLNWYIAEWFVPLIREMIFYVLLLDPLRILAKCDAKIMENRHPLPAITQLKSILTL